MRAPVLLLLSVCPAAVIVLTRAADEECLQILHISRPLLPVAAS
jgi:hypothetical protein